MLEDNIIIIMCNNSLKPSISSDESSLRNSSNERLIGNHNTSVYKVGAHEFLEWKNSVNSIRVLFTKISACKPSNGYGI